MAAGGRLLNTYIKVGDCFIETVCPTDQAWADTTTQTKLLDRQGDCGYMVMIQVPEIGRASTAMSAQGAVAAIGCTVARDVAPGQRPFLPEHPGWKVGDPCPREEGTIASAHVQYHPKDFGTLGQTEEAWPSLPGNDGAWLYGGNDWQLNKHTSSVQNGLAAVEIAPPVGTPEEVCARWAAGLQSSGDCWVDESAAVPTLRIAGGTSMRFVWPDAVGGRTGLVGALHELLAPAGLLWLSRRPAMSPRCHPSVTTLCCSAA